MAETQIPEKELKRSLLSLAMGKTAQRVLCRKGHGREIGLFLFLKAYIFWSYPVFKPRLILYFTLRSVVFLVTAVNLKTFRFFPWSRWVPNDDLKTFYLYRFY